MGGHQDGAYASHLITDLFERARICGDLEQKIKLSLDVLLKAHSALARKSARLGDGVIIGATIAALLIDGHKGASIYAGDSRCYVLRENRLLIATEDHAKTVESSDGERKYLTKALSAPSKFDVDIKRFSVENGDTFLLCTDGFYNALSAAEIRNAMRSDDMGEALESLSAAALSGKADDNLTALMTRAARTC
jgi:serine/threonine protein phosphatase PrpC